MRVGSDCSGNGGGEFVVWAPFLDRVELIMVSPSERRLPMERDSGGYWKAIASDVSSGDSYFFILDGERRRPDPASHFQPEGVHGPSRIIDHNAFGWRDASWSGVPLHDMVIYELHVGTFTPEGTFQAIISKLDDLRDFGISAIEIMPVAQFPGERNWGYDGVYPYAVHNSYGGPDALKELVNECHARGMAVILDVVYNHLGPEGNYLWDYGPYFTKKYHTPWGMAMNFDDAYSDDVRNFFIENALYWYENYHIDALRIDAIHAIYDLSAKPFLEELSERVEAFSKEKGRSYYLIAESDLNDERVLRPRELGGYGLDAQWSDDFHHALHTILTKEKTGYYMDFGDIDHFIKALREGFVYTWKYSPYRRRHHGSSSQSRPGSQFVVCSQNHDQVGNRMLGERMSKLVSFESLKLCAGAVLLSPYIPLLFMGEEYGEESPFLYFVSHSDRDLIQAVREGRKEEFRAFSWNGETPDPQDMNTFLSSKIQWDKRTVGNHKTLLNFYRTLISLRKEIPALASLDKDSLDVAGSGEEKTVTIRRWKSGSSVILIFNFNSEDVTSKSFMPEGRWKKLVDSADILWNGPGTLVPDYVNGGEAIPLRAQSFVLCIWEERL